MEYRLYMMGKKGYEKVLTVWNEDDLWFVMDELIITEGYDETIMVLEHNRELDYDRPFYTYNGNIDKYIQFRYSVDEVKLKI